MLVKKGRFGALDVGFRRAEGPFGGIFASPPQGGMERSKETWQRPLK